MDRTSAANYATVSGKRQFVDQNLIGGVAGTELVAADHNSWMEEILGPIEGAGLAPSNSNLKQLWQAIKRAAGANVGTTITASTTLTPDNAGWVIVDATSANITLTLPLSAAAGGMPFHFHIARIDSAPAHSVAIAFAGSDTTIFTEPTTVAPGQVLEVGASGGTTWINWLESQTGSASLVTTAGWEKRPSGTIEQWAQGVSTTGNGDAITFPITFPTACAGVLLTERAAGGGWAAGGATLYGASGATASGFSLYAKNVAPGGAISAVGGISYFYRALGW